MTQLSACNVIFNKYNLDENNLITSLKTYACQVLNEIILKYPIYLRSLNYTGLVVTRPDKYMYNV